MRMFAVCGAAAFILIAMLLAANAQRVGVSPAGPLSACQVSAAKELAFCAVAGDPANPDGMYVSANGAPYFLVSKAAQPFAPTSFTCTSGTFGTGVPISASGCTFK